MTVERLAKTDRDLADPEFHAIRARAQDLAHAGEWAELLAMRAELERDHDLWPDMWGPWCAVAARRLGEPDATDRLRQLVDAGFTQPELCSGELEAAFAGDPAWPDLAARMARAVPEPPLLLLDWPTATPSAPLRLLDLTGRGEELRARIPAPADTAWATALDLLAWVSRRWPHAAAHTEVDDAVEVLDRVDTGHRFACVEYALVLAQALNTLDVPARRLWLRQRDYHAGVGRAHVVAEAWIDDLGDGTGGWVVLDGQNGTYWTDAGGRPLGAAALRALVAAGGDRADVVCTAAPMSARSADFWFTYFDEITTTAGTWSPGPFSVVFARRRLNTSERLEHSAEPFYPDLSELTVATVLTADGRAALRVEPVHPYAQGVVADGVPLDDGVLVLDTTPGEHEASLAARTRYGPLAGHRLAYRVSG